MEYETPPPTVSGVGGGGLLSKVNPFAILVGMVMAGGISWFISGGDTGVDRRPTNRPRFRLGQQIDGQHTITGIKTRWDYQFDHNPAWHSEELL